MAEVDITINGRSYRISCKNGEEERVKSLPKFDDKSISLLEFISEYLGSNNTSS